MGWIDSAIDTVTEFASDALGLGSSGTGVSDGSNIFGYLYNGNTRGWKSYVANSSNWYKALPYGFRLITRDGSSHVAYLPISPENITIKTHWGTNVIPTMYGTVEEHTEQRYFDILISGNTGFAPKYSEPFMDPGSSPAVGSRASYKDDTSGVGLDPQLAGGFFKKTIGAINQTLNTVNGLAETFTGTQINSGIDPDKSGYMAFHNFYRFLLSYKKDAVGHSSKTARTKHPLTFLNYKDGQAYDCAITNFELKRDAADPMLYKYSIALRAYNLRSVQNATLDVTEDDRLGDLGLDGVEGSAFQKVKQTSNGAKGVLGALSGGSNIFGG